jgi:hypothetical protein
MASPMPIDNLTVEHAFADKKFKFNSLTKTKVRRTQLDLGSFVHPGHHTQKTP